MNDVHFSSYRWGGGWWRGLQNGWCHGTVWRAGVYAQPALWDKRFQTRKTSAHCKTQGSDCSFCSSSSFIYWSLMLTKPDFLSHLQVLLKLFSYCVKVKINRQQLVRPEMNTLNVMLGTLNLVSTSVPVSVNEAVAVGWTCVSLFCFYI